MKYPEEIFPKQRASSGEKMAAHFMFFLYWQTSILFKNAGGTQKATTWEEEEKNILICDCGKVEINKENLNTINYDDSLITFFNNK